MEKTNVLVPSWPIEHFVSGWHGPCRVKAVLLPEQLRIYIDQHGTLSGPIACLDVRSEEKQRHPLQRGLPLTSGASNSIIKAYRDIIGRAFPFDQRHLSDESIKHKGKEQAKLCLFLKDVQSRFLGSLDQTIVRNVRLFPCFRWDIYRFLRKHPDPRVLQLLNSCPAMLGILALGKYDKIFSAEAINTIEKKIVVGVPLQDLLNITFEYLWSARDYFGYLSWEWLNTFRQNNLEDVSKKWTWLVLKSPALLSPGYHLLPPPFYIPKSTYPAKIRSRTKWIIGMKLFRFSWAPGGYGLTESQVQGFLNMIGHKPESVRLFKDRPARLYVGRFLQDQNIHPNSHTNVERLVRDLEAWVRIKKAREIQKRLEPQPEFPLDFKLHQHEFTFAQNEVFIKILVTPADYIHAGERLNNCLGKRDYFHLAHKGTSRHLLCGVHDRLYAMELQLENLEWKVTHLMGQRNRKARPDDERRIRSVLGDQIISALLRNSPSQ